ncbi:cell division cycle protein 16 homolog [Branchiostoma lanceolatum]|uniref:cell division cycle protein 16 homolog n=1 Tax=Branchiostoma lanceolatum TaxID=7740 RepID=UPI0034535E96
MLPLTLKMAGDEIMDSGFGQILVNLDKLRTLVRQYVDAHQYSSALFWADKVSSLSNGEGQDVYWLAQCMFLTGQYHRASHLIRSKKLDKKNAACRYLAARCHAEVREWQQALHILDKLDLEARVGPQVRSDDGKDDKLQFDCGIPQHRVESSIALMRGKIFESLDNRDQATESYRTALKLDVYCEEAFQLLVSHHMLTAQEERELIESLPFAKQCPEEEVELVRLLYETKLKKYDKPRELEIPTSLDPLHENLDVVVNQAERNYYNCNFRTAYKITSKVLQQDPYHNTCLPLHIACLTELKKTTELFYLGHKLVDLYPTDPVAWFAVGCYYLTVGGKHDVARRYLTKATTLNRMFGPAWLAFGHSFAEEAEHDQAMAAYFTAAQLMKGCHLPVLYIGLEYGMTNNLKLAERFFKQALNIAPEDPFVLHEMGVVAFQNGDLDTAEKFFMDALEKVQAIEKEMLTEKWEPLLNNLGHVCRKLGRYEESLTYHRQALVLCPQNPSTMAAIGFVHSLQSHFDMAIDYFHKALGLRRDDTFSVTMLAQTIELYIGEMKPYEGAEELPEKFEGIPLPEYNVGDVKLGDVTAELKLEGDGPMMLESWGQDASTSSLDIEVEMEDS